MQQLRDLSTNTLNQDQINQVNATISQLQKEIKGSGFFNYNKDRKQQKIDALQNLLQKCAQGTSVQEAVQTARAAPGVIEGKLSTRTARLLDNLEHAATESAPENPMPHHPK